MAIQIPNYLSTSPTQITSESPQNAALAGSVAQATGDGLHTMMQAQLAQFDQIKQQTSRAALMKQEADFNASLSQSLPKLFSAIGSTVTHTMDQIKQAQDAASEYDLKLMENSYLVNKQVAVQQELLTYADQAKKVVPENGEGYTLAINDFMNKHILDAAQNAPSAAAALESFTKLSNMKLQATEHAMNYEREQKVTSVVNGVNKTASSLDFQVNSNPDAYDSYKQQLEANKSLLLEAGLDPARAEGVMSKARSNLFQNKIMGLVQKGSFDTALKELHTESSFNLLGANGYSSLTKSVLSAIKSQQEQLNKQVETQQLVTQLQSGLPLPNTKEARDVMDAGFASYVRPMLAQDGSLLPGVSQETFLQQTVNYYKDHKVYEIAPSHKQLLEGSILNGKPDVAFQQSRAVAALMSDGDTARIAAQLDDKAKYEAMKIQRLTSFGVAPADAVTQVRNERTVDPNKIKLAKDRVEEAFRQSAKSKLDPKNPDGSYASLISEFGDIKNVKSAKLDYEELALNYALQTGDPELSIKMATNKLRLKYGISTVNGEKELMQYAPEMTYNSTYLSDFKQGLGTSLSSMSKSLAGVETSGNQLAYKDKNGDVRYVNTKIGPIGGITSNSSSNARVYGLFDSDTGLPILYSDLKPDGAHTQLTYSYDYTKGQTYADALKEHAFNQEQDKAYRDSVAKKQSVVSDLITSSPHFQALTSSEKFGIINMLH